MRRLTRMGPVARTVILQEGPEGHLLGLLFRRYTSCQPLVLCAVERCVERGVDRTHDCACLCGALLKEAASQDGLGWNDLVSQSSRRCATATRTSHLGELCLS
jgi:hypothetical protein